VGVDCAPFKLLPLPSKLPKRFRREEIILREPEVAGWVVGDGMILIRKGADSLEPYRMSAVEY
jgi:hypothetical protein